MKKLLGIVVLGLILAINVEAQETKKLPDISVYDAEFLLKDGSIKIIDF